MKTSDVKIPVPVKDAQSVGRALQNWLNGFPDKPVRRISFEYLPENAPAMALISIQSAYKIKTYLRNQYRAQYPFAIVYRTKPTSDDERLKADEILNEIGAWAESNPDKPALEGRARVRSVSRDSGAGMDARYEDGTEDHKILMNLIYEVI